MRGLGRRGAGVKSGIKCNVTQPHTVSVPLLCALQSDTGFNIYMYVPITGIQGIMRFTLTPLSRVRLEKLSLA
jgi:hypothetical protein